MYSYERFYDHFCIKENDKIITHVDTEAEAKKIVFELKSENVDTDTDHVKNVGRNYTVYHLHTEYSLLDSCTNYKDYINNAVQLGQTAIGFTEHGNLYGWANKYFYCKEKGIKYLHGIEVYLTETLDEKIRDNYHTVLIAKNQKGFEEINKLFFLSTREDHVYYKPRLTFEEFLNISDNVIKISACVQSPLNKYMLKIKDGYTKEQCNMLVSLLKHYDYYEIQYHNMKEQI
jgi:DNA polymerase-3 subunit alpha